MEREDNFKEKNEVIVTGEGTVQVRAGMAYTIAKEEDGKTYWTEASW